MSICWNTPNVKTCDAPNCKMPAMINNYPMIHQIIEEIKKNIYFPSGIFGIIFSQLFPEFCAGYNGLCIEHNNIYNECNDCVFNVIPKCNTCTKSIWSDVKKIMECRDNNITHHHKALGICRDFFDFSSVLNDDILSFSRDWCINFCRQLGTWCDICKKCIGHPYKCGDCDKRTIINCPHCLICSEHSRFPHCMVCNKHSQCVCNLERDNNKVDTIDEIKNLCKQCVKIGIENYSKNPHCALNGCSIHSEFPHCEVEKCFIHSEYSHCVINGCNKHSESPHCPSCNFHHSCKNL